MKDLQANAAPLTSWLEHFELWAEQQGIDLSDLTVHQSAELIDQFEGQR